MLTRLKRASSRIFVKATKFLTVWAGVFYMAGGTGVCPFCGQPGCPVGIGTAGFLGGLVASILFLPRWLRSRFHHNKTTKNCIDKNESAEGEGKASTHDGNIMNQSHYQKHQIG
jgi:hypothetical protein